MKPTQKNKTHFWSISITFPRVFLYFTNHTTLTWALVPTVKVSKSETTGFTLSCCKVGWGGEGIYIYIYIYHQTFLSKDLISEPINGIRWVSNPWLLVERELNFRDSPLQKPCHQLTMCHKHIPFDEYFSGMLINTCFFIGVNMKFQHLPCNLIGKTQIYNELASKAMNLLPNDNQMFSPPRCVSDAPRCFSDASQMPFRCLPDASHMLLSSRCLPNDSQMPSKCFSDASQMLLRCLWDVS